MKTCLLSLLILLFASSIQGRAEMPAGQVDEPFLEDVSTQFTQEHGLPGANIHAFALLSDGSVVAAGTAGLSILVGEEFKPFAPDPGFEVEILETHEGTLWAAGANRVSELADGQWKPYAVPEDSVLRALAFRDGRPLLATDKGLLAGDETGRFQPVPGLDADVLCVASTKDRIALGTTDGLLMASVAPNWKDWKFVQVNPRDDRHSWAPTGVSVLGAANDHLWFGSDQGAGLQTEAGWSLFTGKEGLPYDHFTCVDVRDGIVWFGTQWGAIRYDGNRWSYRASKRWLPDDYVNDLKIGEDGVAWIATRGGIARIAPTPVTLAEKAERFEEIIDKRHRRMGFVVRCHLKEEGNFETAWVNHTDNDGLYTATYGASQAFRYGATKEPEAKQRAQDVFKALRLLFDATSIPGFPARSVVPADWEPNPGKGFPRAANKELKKEDPLWKDIYPRWPLSADGKYYWKCDTSSDEICGHYFFYAVYYDLVAETEEERAEVREVVRALSDHIVENNFCMVDHDGKPTRWGQWSPEYVNSRYGWADRGLQSVEILSFLNVANHITGDEKYLAASKKLRDEHDYHINAISGRAVFPPANVVPWDNNLAFLSYYSLLKYEKDPKLLELWEASIDRNWLFASHQNDPFFTFSYLSLNKNRNGFMIDETPIDFDSAARKAVETLRRTPQLLLGWELKNSHRLDVVQDPTPGQRPGYGWSAVTGGALPIDERSHIRINSDHFDLDTQRGGGTVEYEGSFYLLPYYLGLYTGILD